MEETMQYKHRKEISKTNEPLHDKTNKITCATSKDSYQPVHSPSLISVFAVCMKKNGVLVYPKAQSQDWSH